MLSLMEGLKRTKES